MTMPKSLEQRDAAWNRRALTAAQQQGQAAPPIAPVGVEAIREAFDEISGLCRHLRQGGPAPEDLQDLSDALDEAVGIAANMLHALAQQPAAADEARSVSSILDGAVSFVEALAAQLQGGAE